MQRFGQKRTSPATFTYGGDVFNFGLFEARVNGAGSCLQIWNFSIHFFQNNYNMDKFHVFAFKNNTPTCLLHSKKNIQLYTGVVIDATEVYIDQPKPPEIQQMTFSNYKNNNIYKGLMGISPDGVVIFISSLYPGSISDKELTRKCGILDLLEPGDSVMADRGFDIEEDLILRGVHLNIPPFLQGKQQFSQEELITTRRIASLRIHVERAMERIKNFHIFDRSLPVTLMDIADRLFLCVVL